MLTRRNIMLGAAFALIAAPAASAAADESPRAFVTAIYDTYVGKSGNGVALDSDRAVQRYLEPSLGALIRKDQKEAARRNETATLDFDPFVDAQDWDIAAFKIEISDTGPDKASATVKFNNSEKPTTVVLDLVKIKNEWKISNIAWKRDDKTETLRALFGH
jgi:hypothetical protein